LKNQDNSIPSLVLVDIRRNPGKVQGWIPTDGVSQQRRIQFRWPGRNNFDPLREERPDPRLAARPSGAAAPGRGPPAARDAPWKQPQQGVFSYPQIPHPQIRSWDSTFLDLKKYSKQASEIYIPLPESWFYFRVLVSRLTGLVENVVYLNCYGIPQRIVPKHQLGPSCLFG